LLIGCPGPRSSAVSDAVDFWLHACHLRRVGMLGSAVLRSPPWPSSQSWPLPSGKNGSTSCSAYGSQRLRGLSGSLVTQPPPGSTCSLASLSRSCPPPGCGSCTAARRARHGLMRSGRGLLPLGPQARFWDIELTSDRLGDLFARSRTRNSSTACLAFFQSVPRPLRCCQSLHPLLRC
jgi:hypothetical protein